MKYLSDYTNDKQSELFKTTGAFFAFSGKQFNEGKQEGVKYTNLGDGMICPSEHVNTLIDGLEVIQKEAMSQDVIDNGVKAIIHRELGNHECAYVGNYDEVVDVLAPYGILKEQIAAEWSEYASKSENY